MSCARPQRAGAYATGYLGSGCRIAHPGGEGLTLRALQLAEVRPPARVLDLGCGSGETVQLMRSLGFDAYGVDPARSTHGSEEPYVMTAFADELPFATASFDAVIAECSLSLMPRQPAVLGECARIVHPGGSLMLCDLYARNPEAIGAVRRLTDTCVSGLLVREQLEAWLQQEGFVVTCFEDHSRALRESLARFLFEQDSSESLWGQDAQESERIDEAMHQVRPGYFMLTAVRADERHGEKGDNDGR